MDERQEKIQMLDDFYENNGYDVLNRTAEDISTWRESIRKKCQKPAVQQTNDERITTFDSR